MPLEICTYIGPGYQAFLIIGPMRPHTMDQPTTIQPDKIGDLGKGIASLLILSVWDLRQEAGRIFEPLGLTLFQVTILSCVANQSKIQPSDLAERLGVLREAMSSMLTKLTERGLLERNTDEQDRRSRILSLTNRGQQALLEANGLWCRAIEQRYGEITPEDKSAFFRILQAKNS